MLGKMCKRIVGIKKTLKFFYWTCFTAHHDRRLGPLQSAFYENWESALGNWQVPSGLTGQFCYSSFGEENQQVVPSEGSVSLSQIEWKSELGKPLSGGKAPLTDGYISFISPVASNRLLPLTREVCSDHNVTGLNFLLRNAKLISEQYITGGL
jgi:hypothetical protein